MVTAIVRHGRWWAICPDPECFGGAERFEPILAPDRPGWTGLHPDWFRCSACGYHDTDVRWPANADDIARVLSMRPLVNRNWAPPETLDDLILENMAHGCIPLEGITGGPLIVAVGGRLVGGLALPAASARMLALPKGT